MKTPLIILCTLFSVLCVSTLSARDHVRLREYRWDTAGKSIGKINVEAYTDDNGSSLTIQFNKAYGEVQIVLTSDDTGAEIYTDNPVTAEGSIVTIPIERSCSNESFSLVINTEISLITGSFLVE